MKETDLNRIAEADSERMKDKSRVLFLEEKVKELETRSLTVESDEKHLETIAELQSQVAELGKSLTESETKVTKAQNEITALKAQYDKERALTQQQTEFKAKELDHLNSLLASEKELRMSQANVATSGPQMQGRESPRSPELSLRAPKPQSCPKTQEHQEVLSL